MRFNIGTQSDGGKALAWLQGGYRHPYTMDSLKIELDQLRDFKHEMETEPFAQLWGTKEDYTE